MFTNPAQVAVSQSAIIAERLLAHARLCRDVADASCNEDTAAKLERLAEECARAAAEITPDLDGGAPVH
jgi:hypothetical protein